MSSSGGKATSSFAGADPAGLRVQAGGRREACAPVMHHEIPRTELASGPGLRIVRDTPSGVVVPERSNCMSVESWTLDTLVEAYKQHQRRTRGLRIRSTDIYRHADLALKERALARLAPTRLAAGRYRP